MATNCGWSSRRRRGRPGRSTSARSTRRCPAWSATGLVEPGESDEQGRVVYTITAAGREELARWFSTPVVQSDRPRDELVIKLAMAVAAKKVDVSEVIRKQRTATMRALQELTRAKRAATEGAVQRLVLDSMIFQAEAEQRWLDHCEAVLKEER
ncbi:hypothetical protein GCM10020219_092510 [Nonomuraea dietziae]